MLPAERQRRIVELVTADNGRSVESLAEELGYSKATIRRDLHELAERGRIERSHGGAVPVTNVGHEAAYGQKEVRNLDAKRAIAGRAVEEIGHGHVVFFDAGTTTMQVAEAAPDDGSMTAVTNSPEIALELGVEDRTVKLTGGTVRPRTRSLVGPTAESFLGRMNFDLLFLGANAIDVETGLTTPNEDEARAKELMVQRASRVVLVADSSKIGDRSFVTFAGLDDVDLFVTDDGIAERDRGRFQAEEVAVVTAEPDCS
ncbi:MAG: HTH-type transcriptional regulator GlpR [Halobellus sp.]|uniref:HTH-type transcriptional regulator GlpR n=1 Tax=Halobellus sp. TaxID=1979212 RepID=UPI0035D4FBD3